MSTWTGRVSRHFAMGSALPTKFFAWLYMGLYTFSVMTMQQLGRPRSCMNVRKDMSIACGTGGDSP